jgi:hypothetical protein
VGAGSVSGGKFFEGMGGSSWTLGLLGAGFLTHGVSEVLGK